MNPKNALAVERIERDFARQLNLVAEQADRDKSTGKVLIIVEINMATGGIARADIEDSRKRGIKL